ncbi:hypothetical protein BOTBODRAFT_54595 [Botryobasidium botryosum FD-172 SS1]|uniref:Thioredoxin domain-containing protein n=1 Tax=Botryobasidium botryosum (strain FD-172 SS1) TaxID=930990 RepID=A0A067MJI4_BOTB1|nr:hypothetical protein BOTBODRAFT_54595 [Botryobasidium botryosum FD-172 SS1]
MSTITHLTSSAQLSQILSSAKDKLTVIDFHATWYAIMLCGPCHAIAPKFESLSKEYKQVVFCKCDVDACSEVARTYSVSAMPTFIFLKDGVKVDQVRGADPRALENTIKKHAGTGSSSSATPFSGKGHTLSGSTTSPSPAAAAAEAVGGISSLDPQVKLLLALVGRFVFPRAKLRHNLG